MLTFVAMKNGKPTKRLPKGYLLIVTVIRIKKMMLHLQ